MPKLFMLLIGCSPAGRHTEQHDVFFSIGENIRDILPQLPDFWPEAKTTLHLDAWREVTCENGYSIEVVAKEDTVTSEAQLFFINLGGYKPAEFEEFHYKMIAIAAEKGEAIRQSKQTVFYKHTGFKGANSHVDDKYGVDVDDVYAIKDILPQNIKDDYTLRIYKNDNAIPDELHLGYFIPRNVDKWSPR